MKFEEIKNSAKNCFKISLFLPLVKSKNEYQNFPKKTLNKEDKTLNVPFFFNFDAHFWTLKGRKSEILKHF
jgi:hypothetical protein